MAVGVLDAGSRSTVRKSLNSRKHLHTLLNEVESSTPHDESKKIIKNVLQLNLLLYLTLMHPFSRLQ